MPPPRGTKYQPLADYLAAQSADEVTLSLAQIDAILRAPLPTSAYFLAWWRSKGANRRASQPWRAAGWEVAAVAWRDGERRVTFRRRPVGAYDNRLT